MNEYKFLDAASSTYECRNSAFLKIIKKLNINVMEPYLLQKKDGVALELGCGEGDSTMLLHKYFQKLIVRDGSMEFLKKAENSLFEIDNIEFQYGLFEEIQEENSYDFIIANYIFEHVESIEAILTICYKALKENGFLFITVPNAKALSRKLAVEMGLLDNIYSLTENDIKHGHRRVFDMETLISEINKTKFSVVENGGLYVKPFADFQLKEMVDNNMLNESHFIGLQKLAKQYVDIAGSIFVCVQK